MSKAEEKSKQYREYREQCGIKDPVMLNEIEEAYYEGYNQAEKDLRDISWIKEISGVKELSRAKEEALKAYPPRSIAANYDTINRRDAFEYGYLKAEKDLELTWENVKEIYCIALNLREHVGSSVFGQPFYEEVLKQFKDLKHVKQKI